MTNIISFSVWGNDSKYLNGCLENARLAKEIYTGWISYFYCDSYMDESFIKNLRDTGSEVFVVKAMKSCWEGLFWRFLPASDADVFISRDVDSRLNKREKAAVDEWLKSDKDIHCMRDHIEHNVPMLGGMWGCRNKIIPNIKELIGNWSPKNCKGSDQDFLRTKIWNYYRDKIIVHDRYYNGLTIENKEYKIGYISKYDADNPTEGEAVPEYIYDPITFFGEHLIKPFPPHEEMVYGTYVGEII